MYYRITTYISSRNTVLLKYLDELQGLFLHNIANKRVHINILPDTRRFTSAFAKLRKSTISCDISVRLSVLNNSVPTGRIYMKRYT
jgi:hypothetical protein